MLGSFGFPNFVLIRYEDLVLDTEGQLARIAAALGVPAPGHVAHQYAPVKNYGAFNG
jgi:hypothetical protein